MRSLHDSRYSAFTRLLREARLAAGLTQAEVAAALGRPQSFVAKIERGERRVDVIELADLAEVLDKPIVFFLPDGSKSGRRHK